jgi:short-subunit dehydrogenase
MARNHAGTTAIITGASSGIGAEFARTLAARGANLVLIARRDDRLAALADELAAAHGVTVHPLALDLAAPGAVDAVTTFVRERGLTVDSVVNNAGFGMHGPLAEADASRIDEQVRLNVGALVSLTRAFLPGMTASGRGILVNVASTAAFQPVPFMAVYGATKAFVLSFTEAVAFETRESGLRVTALCPGPTRTEFFEVVGTERARVGDYQSPAQVVATAMRALDARRTPPSVVSGSRNAVTAVMARIMPRSIVIPMTGRLMAQRASTPSPAAATR